MKGIRMILSVGMVLAVFVPCLTLDSGDYEYKIVNYVALGDSIAEGYGLQNAEEECYVGRITKALEQKYDAVHTVNLGKSGQRSDELLEILSNPGNKDHNKYVEEIKRADLITLSIGSNDLLRYLSGDLNIGELKENGDQIFTAACQRFGKNLPQIIEILRQNAPNAQLFVNNVYNPCKDVSCQNSDSLPWNLDRLAEQYIGQINHEFFSQKAQSVFHNFGDEKETADEYVLVDVKSAFEQSGEKLINKIVSWHNIDPHPNKEGHKVIADLIIPQIEIQKQKEG